MIWCLTLPRFRCPACRIITTHGVPDIGQRLSWVSPQGNALAYRAAASCDLLATFLDSSAPWWILVFAVLWVIGNIFLSRCAPAMLLKCALWLYIGYDVLVWPRCAAPELLAAW
jgi:hypothetical protein